MELSVQPCFLNSYLYQIYKKWCRFKIFSESVNEMFLLQQQCPQWKMSYNTAIEISEIFGGSSIKVQVCEIQAIMKAWILT